MSPESSAEMQGNSTVSQEGGAKSGALPTDLQQLVTRWPKLPEAIRIGILAFVSSVKETNRTSGS